MNRAKINMKKIMGWVLFSLGIAFLLCFVFSLVLFGNKPATETSSTLWVLVVAGVVEIWQGWRLSHPKSNAKKIMKE